MRRAPKNGYNFEAKETYREDIWSTFGQHFDRCGINRGDAIVAFMPSKEGLEIPVAIKHGFSPDNLIAIDASAALLATAKWRKDYPSIRVYGSELGRACERIAKDGIVLNGMNADLCSQFSSPQIDTMMALRQNLKIAEGFIFALTVLKGRESPAFSALLGKLVRDKTSSFPARLVVPAQEMTPHGKKLIDLKWNEYRSQTQTMIYGMWATDINTKLNENDKKLIEYVRSESDYYWVFLRSKSKHTDDKRAVRKYLNVLGHIHGNYRFEHYDKLSLCLKRIENSEKNNWKPMGERHGDQIIYDIGWYDEDEGSWTEHSHEDWVSKTKEYIIPFLEKIKDMWGIGESSTSRLSDHTMMFKKDFEELESFTEWVFKNDTFDRCQRVRDKMVQFDNDLYGRTNGDAHDWYDMSDVLESCRKSYTALISDQTKRPEGVLNKFIGEVREISEMRIPKKAVKNVKTILKMLESVEIESYVSANKVFYAYDYGGTIYDQLKISKDRYEHLVSKREEYLAYWTDDKIVSEMKNYTTKSSFSKVAGAAWRATKDSEFNNLWDKSRRDDLTHHPKRDTGKESYCAHAAIR